MASRAAHLEQLDGGTFDVLVVGGGINGAVSAAALAGRGAQVALVDRGDFGAFTSQASSNLVWGGFKYLEHYELPLVYGLCQSRNRLLRAYPANIRELRFLASLDHGSPYSPGFAALGAWAYWLIGLGGTCRPRWLSRADIAAAEPAIDTTRVRGGIEYGDAWLVDNDARFVFSFVRAALEAGATVANYVELVAARRVGMRWQVTLRDSDSGADYTATARVLVNAAGPFADALNAGLAVETDHTLVLSKGIHLVVPRLTTTRHDRVLAFYDDTQRLFYVIPMGRRSVIGTTDTRVADPHTRVEDADRAFLLDQINRRLARAAPLTAEDVIAERCGVRPLVIPRAVSTDVTADWTALSRRHVIECDRARGVVTILGGKLTDCLNVGEEVAAHVAGLGVTLEAETGNWYGEPPRATRDAFYRQARLMRLDALRTRPDTEPLTERLWRRYGQRGFDMLEAIRDDADMGEDILENADYLRVELHLAAHTEMITQFADFMRRRSKIDLVVRREDVLGAKGLREAAEILFGADADRRLAEYLAAR